MPLYEYECDACGQRFEVIQKFSDPHAETCAACGKGPVRRLLSSPAIQFKGSGWYITDYAQKGKTDSGGGATEKSQPADQGTKSDKTDKTETKTEAKSDTASSSSSAPAAAKS